MKRSVIGVIGHVDHGKTALVRALTGIETDRLPEERRRGISIALGFAHLTIGDAIVDFIDMPGHERFVRTMVSGATGIDAALLVVAATEGIKPQTIEHAEIAGLLGLRRAVVAISKSDLVSADQAHEVAIQAIALLRRVGLTADAAIPVSILNGSGLDELRTALAAETAAPRTAEGEPFLPIDRAFSIQGHGTVVTGTLRGGAVAPGDTLTLWPGQRPHRIRGLQVHGAKAARAVPGQRVALNLRDAGLEEIRPGSILAAAGSLSEASWLSVALRAVDNAPPIANAARLRALLGTVEIGVRLRLLDRDVLEPGETALAQVHCHTVIAIPARERVILRLPSPAQTVAGGIVIEPETVRLRRRDTAILARLAPLRDLSPREIVSAEAARFGAAGTSVRHLSRLSALPPPLVAAVLADAGMVVSREGMVVHPAALETTVERIRSLVAVQALARDQLAAALPAVGRAVMDEALARLIAAGAVSEAQGRIGERHVAVEQDRARSEMVLRGEIAETLRQGGLMPPDIAASGERQRALDRLVRAGVVIRAPDPAQKRVVHFHQDAVAEARRQLQSLLAHPPGLLVSEVGAALGISRKYSVPLLEYLDQIRFTRRVQDRRILAPSAAQAALKEAGLCNS